MISPTAFESNVQAMGDNYFMRAGGNDAGTSSSESAADAKEALRAKVVAEHEGLVTVLRDVIGATVHVFAHAESYGTPDAVFPNNWFGTDCDLSQQTRKRLTLFPMRHPNRRAERRDDLVRYLKARYSELIDLTPHETSSASGHPGKFLEGTGAMVLDRIYKVAYVSLSERADEGVANVWCVAHGYGLQTFNAKDTQGRPIYHTNVMMSVGTRGAILCRPSLSDDEYAAVARGLTETGRKIIDIDFAQMGNMCGNVLEVKGRNGTLCLLMSTNAFDSFSETQLAEINSAWDSVAVASIPTIEEIGGGGVRCCVAELF